MSYLFWGTVILFSATLIYYLVFFGLAYYWHERKVSVVVVPLLFTFEFFLVSFLIMAAVVIVIQYWPEISLLIGDVVAANQWR